MSESLTPNSTPANITPPRRAIILAAGMGKRIAPLSYERPKGLLTVRGQVLIERLIGQLHEAGVTDITVVVGYMKEAFFYLEDLLGVSIRVNADYAERRNHSSLMVARDKLPRSYICAPNQYLEDNLFLQAQETSYCSVVPLGDVSKGPAVRVDAAGFIELASATTTTDAPAATGLSLLRLEGPAYLDQGTGERLAHILEEGYTEPGMAACSWEDVVLAHTDQLHLRARVLEPGVVTEFSSLDDLQHFDCDFMDNVDSTILDNICATLECQRHDICNVVPIKQGLTNLSFRFDEAGTTYVYRHPGAGTNEIINRESEAFALGVAKRLGLDGTYIHEDPASGRKLSQYLHGCVPFDYHDKTQVRRALQLVRQLHQSGETSPWSFDFHEETCNIAASLRRSEYPMPPDFDELSASIAKLATLMRTDAGEPCLCHNDFYGPNLLVRGDDMWLIDWEYAAMGDYACDLGNFVAQGSGYTIDEARAVLDYYFDREPTPQEVRHCMAAVAVVGYYWYVWAIFKEFKGNPMGEWLYIWYKSAKQFGAYALGLYA